MAKTKALISCTVTTQLIFVFVFAYTKAGFLMMQQSRPPMQLCIRNNIFNCKLSPMDSLQSKMLILSSFLSPIVNCEWRCPLSTTWCGYLSLIVIKPAFCICENKDADQLRRYCAADQRLCFHHIDSAIPLLSKSKILSL